MSWETQVTTLLKTLCPRVFPDTAPVGTAVPYVTYQQIGGPRLRSFNKVAADKRQVSVQINVYAGSRKDANALCRLIEEGMCASLVFNATEDAEPIWEHDPIVVPGAQNGLYSTIQDFTVVADR